MAKHEGKSPLTARERRIWRAGLLAGSALTAKALNTAIDQHLDRVRFRGVEAEPPADFSDEHPLERLEVRPQLKRRRIG
jgi:hypothetical protein